jgi:hypothetical protein
MRSEKLDTECKKTMLNEIHNLEKTEGYVSGEELNF